MTLIRRLLSWVVVGAVCAWGWAQPPIPKAKVTIRLVAPDGKTPVSDGLVVLAPEGMSPDPRKPGVQMRRVSSREDAITFQDVPIGPYQLYVFFPRSMTGKFRLTAPAPFQTAVSVDRDVVDLTVPLKGLPALTGRVRGCEDLPPGVTTHLSMSTVRLSRSMGSAAVRNAELSANGSLYIPMPPQEPCRLSLGITSGDEDHPAYLWWPVTRWSPGDGPIEISWPEFPPLEGRILAPSGKPLPHASGYLVLRVPAPAYSGKFAAAITTGADGSFRLDHVPPMADGLYAEFDDVGAGYAGRWRAGARVEIALQPYGSVEVESKLFGNREAGATNVRLYHQAVCTEPVSLRKPSQQMVEHGRVSFDKLPAGCYRMTISGLNIRHHYEHLAVEPGKKTVRQVTLFPAGLYQVGVVRGKVLDVNGHPVGGATVTCINDLLSGRPTVAVQSKEDGSFALAVEKPQVAVLVAMASGRGFGRCEWSEGDENISIVLLPGTAALAGVVTHSRGGPPVARAVVLAVPLHLLSPRLFSSRVSRSGWLDRLCQCVPSAVADEDGRYHISGLTPGLWTVIIRGEGFRPQVIRNFIVRPGLDPPTTLNVAIQPNKVARLVNVQMVRRTSRQNELRLRLVDEQQHSLAKTWVQVKGAYIRNHARTTDEDGLVTLTLSGLKSGQVTVEVYDYLPTTLSWSADQLPKNPRTVVLKRRRRGSLPVHCVYADTGQPVRGAMTAAADRLTSGWSLHSACAAFTSSSGDAVLPFVAAGEGAVFTWSPHDDYASVWTSIDFDPDRPRPVTVRLPRALAASGMAVDSKQRPLPHRLIIARPAHYPLPSIMALADGSGRFKLEGMCPGKWQLAGSYSGIGESATPVQVELKPDGATTDIHVIYKPSQNSSRSSSPIARIEGRVLSPDGVTPFPGATVECVGLFPVVGGGARLTASAADGRFTATGRPSGSRIPAALAWVPGVGVAVWDPWQSKYGALDVHLTLRPGLDLRGVALTGAGKPAAGVMVAAKLRSMTRIVFQRMQMLTDGVRTITDDQGRFEFPDLPPGRWQVLAESAGRPISSRQEVELKEGDTPTDVTLRLNPGAVDWQGASRLPRLAGLGPDSRGAS